MNWQEYINRINKLSIMSDEVYKTPDKTTIDNALKLIKYLEKNNIIDQLKIWPSPRGTIYFDFSLEVIEVDNKGALWFSNVDPDSSLEMPIFKEKHIEEINEYIRKN